MNIRDFIKELALYYSFGQTEEAKKAKIEAYVDVIGEKVHNHYKEYDYKALLRHLQFKYKSLPTLKELSGELIVGKVKSPDNYSGMEGQTIKREINGHIYEFTIVPNHWENVKTIQELDREIAYKKQKVI